MKENSLFFKKFIAKRGEIGSVMPSSLPLVKKITNSIPFHEVKTLVELGGGTGAITHALINKKEKKTRLLVLEPDEQFFIFLEKKYSNDRKTTILKEKAENLKMILNRFHLHTSECIVCSLPFATMGREKTTKILTEIRKCMKQDSLFVFFQYTPLMLPIFLKQFRIKKVSYVLLNVPPALVFWCSPLEK